MVVIDADTHVDESEATWKRMDGTAVRYAPVTVMQQTEESPTGSFDARSRSWLVEGQLQSRAIRDEIHHPLQVARELQDVQVRLRDMDRLGVDVQVIFPTFFIRYGNTDPESEAALTASYNRWIAEQCAPTNGRLRWTAVLPLLSIDKAAEELRWAKAHGACGVFRRGYDLDKKVSDPYFFPLYEEASALDLPVCIHTGHPLPGREWDRGYPVMSAFSAVITSRLPDQFPQLRFGFIEAGASWIPYVISQLAALRRANQLHERSSTFDLKTDLFRENRLFVSIDPTDDIEYLLTLGAEDNLMVGTDYCHTDQSAYLDAMKEVAGWVDEDKISETVARKILETNPQVFYGL